MAKKKPNPKGSKKGGKKVVLILLVPSKGADPTEATASKNTAAGGSPDQVQWQNNDTRGHTLTFTVWPFKEAPQAIVVEAGKKSKKFTIYANATERLYSYTIEPSINPPSGPPDEPGVIVDA
jgi:hypothetical protein